MSGNQRIRQDKEIVVVEKASLKTPERREGGSHADTHADSQPWEANAKALG